MELIFSEDFFDEIQLNNKLAENMTALNLTWDGSDIGAIDNHIYQCQKFEDDHILTLLALSPKGMTKFVHVKILKYKNEVPFIIDECKPLFGLPKTGKHKATLKDVKVTLVKFQGDISLKKYLKDTNFKPDKMGLYFLTEMRKLLAFRCLMCLNNNWENTIEVRTGTGINYPISCRENTFNYDPMSSATRIPKTLTKTWFNDDEFLADEITTNLIKDKDVSMLRFEIKKIIMKFDKDLISWCNGIFDKILLTQRD
jgi:hypothetical protein